MLEDPAAAAKLLLEFASATEGPSREAL